MVARNNMLPAGRFGHAIHFMLKLTREEIPNISQFVISPALKHLERKYDHKLKTVFDAIRQLMSEAETDEKTPPREIGFHAVPLPSKDSSQPAKRKQS
jgi:hypothetical protein